MIRQERRSSERAMMELKTELVINENIYESNIENLSKNGLKVYAERDKEEVAGYPFAHKEKHPLGIVSVSGCVASFPEDADTINKVIKLADKALYKAKEEGRNRVVKHESSNKLLRIGS